MPTLLSVLNLIMLGISIAVVVYAYRLQRQRTQQRQRLLRQHAVTLQHGHWFPIRYATASRFRSWLKILPWQHSGILHIDAHRLTIYLDNNEIIDMPASTTQIEWLGKKFLPNGLVSWFTLTHQGRGHYLTSETGMTVIHSADSTVNIFSQVIALCEGKLPITKPLPYSTAFALEKNPHALWNVALFFVLLFYFLIDQFFLLDEDYVTWPSKLIFISFGVAMVLASYFYLSRCLVPQTESTVIALLLCAASVAALYPGLRRVSQWTDTEGLQTYRYTFTETQLLLPEDRDLPRLTLATQQRDRAFWTQYKPGDVFEVRLRHSVLGFYQIDMQPIYAQMRVFYTKQRELKQQSQPALGE